MTPIKNFLNSSSPVINALFFLNVHELLFSFCLFVLQCNYNFIAKCQYIDCTVLFVFTVKYHIFYASFLSQFSFLYYLKVVNVESGTADN